MEKEAVVQFFGQLVELDAADQQCIRERFVVLSARNKQYLLQSGDVCQQLFFVRSGCVRVSIAGQSGDDITCYFGMEGQFVANYESFLTGKPSPYSLQCLEDCTLLAIDRKGLQELYEHVRYGDRIGRLMAEHLFIDTIERLTSFYTETPEQRYQQFLSAYPGLIQRIPQHYIATYIGVRPQSLSRIKRRALEMAAH
jgi:CRP-like cAMP-binding protein